MRLIFKLTFAALLGSSSAFAGYDGTWWQSAGFPGEYPTGFAAIEKYTIVNGRTDMDKDLPANIKCELPYRGVFQQWNTSRNKKSHVSYKAASKIYPMVAKEDFELDGENSQKISIKKGDIIEYMKYGSEGWFTVRIAGKLMGADQSLFDHLEPVPQDALVHDLWVQLTCENGRRAYLFLNDLMPRQANESVNYIKGISDVGPGLTGYGSARDLTEREARKMRHQKAKDNSSK